MNKLGELLKTLRGYNSLRTISEKTNGKISFSYLAILEKGVKPNGDPAIPKPETLKVLSEVYNYPYEELMRLAGHLEDNQSKIDKLFKEYNKLSEEEKEKFRNMILKTI